MPSNEPRDQLAELLAEQLYDRGEYVADWPEDERALQRDHTAWTDFRDRAEKVQRLRFEKAADAVIAFTGGWRPPPRRIEDRDELDTLQAGTLVREETGMQRAWELHSVDLVGYYKAAWWTQPGSKSAYKSGHLELPVTVLWEPEEERDA